VTNKKGITYKRFKGIIKDLVFNNPRADRQFPDNEPSQDEYDRSMLYDFMKTVYKKGKLP